MKIVAAYSLHIGLRDAEEVVLRGETFEPSGTGHMSASDMAKAMIASGAAMTTDDWEKRKPSRDANWTATRQMIGLV